MDHIKNILIEEKVHSEKLLSKYEEALNNIQNGSLSKKVIKGNEYYYLVYRENGKLIFKYLGKLSDSELEKFAQNKKKKEQHRENIRKLKKQINYLNRIIK